MRRLHRVRIFIVWGLREEMVSWNDEDCNAYPPVYRFHIEKLSMVDDRLVDLTGFFSVLISPHAARPQKTKLRSS
jgi:hypothetical protein